MNLLPYPEYKDSGVPWLGRGFPSIGNACRTVLFFSEIKDQGHANEPLLSVTITKGSYLNQNFSQIPQKTRQTLINPNTNSSVLMISLTTRCELGRAR